MAKSIEMYARNFREFSEKSRDATSLLRLEWIRCRSKLVTPVSSTAPGSATSPPTVSLTVPGRATSPLPVSRTVPGLAMSPPAIQLLPGARLVDIDKQLPAVLHTENHLLDHRLVWHHIFFPKTTNCRSRRPCPIVRATTELASRLFISAQWS